jgi:hypothetical protein
MARNELTLIKELLPIWSRYSDGFIFMLDSCTDNTEEYLNEVKDQYNILEILTVDQNIDKELWIETDVRGRLFNAARKYSNSIICLDADEYLDGTLTKQELEVTLENNPDTVFHLPWIQYTSINTIRVDGPWKNNIKDRIGSYTKDISFKKAQTHSTHLPITERQTVFDKSQLFVSHLQWLNKNHVAIKQYFWKVTDYINNKKYGIEVAGNTAYDQSVNNFEWEEEYFDYQLKIRDDIFEDKTNAENYRVQWIKENSEKYEVPNLGDWGYNIHNSIPMYFCTVADDKHYPILINMISSIHKHNFYDVEKILVYDLGLSEIHKQELKNIKKVELCEVEKTNPDILTDIETGVNRKVRGLFSWKPVIIKDALDKCPYVLYLDAGTTILRPLNNLFKHIKQNGYLLFDCGHSIKWMTTKYLIDKLDLSSDSNKWILEDNVFGIDAGFQGVSRSLYDSYVMPMYEFAKDIKNFEDDGTCPNGWGTGRHDQTLFSILARQLGLELIYHDNKENPCYLKIDNKKIDFHITHTANWVTDKTTIFRSRWNINYDSFKSNTFYLKRKYIVSVITGVGKLEKYERFIPRYFDNIQSQIGFDKIEFIIVYSEWSKYFDQYINYPNIKFIKENESLGVYNAWNIGIQNSTSEYITNWNVDDIRFEINSIIKYHLLSKNKDIDLVYNYYIGVYEDELDTVDLSKKKYIEYPDNFHEQVLSMCMAGPDPVWRKCAHFFFGFFDFKEFSIIGDWEMWVRMAFSGLKFKLIPHPLSIYVDHKDTVSNTNVDKIKEQQIKLKQKYTR